SLAYGEFGENITTGGIDVNDALIGERWQIGTIVVEVSEPRIPCWRLGVRMNDRMFPRRFSHALRPGAYFRIVVEGHVGPGMRFGSSRHLITISPSEICFASTPGTAMNSGDCLRFPGCPRAGRNGRAMCFKRLRIVPQMRPNQGAVPNFNFAGPRDARGGA